MGKAGQAAATVILGLLATSAGARAETYADALRSARSGPRTAVARARYLASTARTAIAVANGRPRLTLEANATRDINSDVYGPRLRDQTTAQLVVPLYAGGRVRASIAAARADARSRHELMAAEDLQLAVDVADVYGAVREARALSAVAADEVDRLSLAARRIDAERRAGALALTDTAEVRARLATARRGAIDAGRRDADAATQFEEVVGRPPERVLAPLDVHPLDASDPDGAIRVGNPELRGLRLAIDAAREQVEAERALYRPTLSLVASAVYGNTGAAWADRSTFNLPDGTLRQIASPRPFAHRFAASGLLVLRIPLSRGGEVGARVARAQANRRAAETRARERETAVLALARQSLAQARAALRQAALAEDAVDASREALKGVDIARSIGERSEYDELVAITELADAGRQRARLEREAAHQTVLSLAAAGHLPEPRAPSASGDGAGPHVATSVDRFDLAAQPGSRITYAPGRPLAYDMAGLG